MMSIREEVIKVKACRKLPIDWWTRYFCYVISVRLVVLLARLRVSPNQVTLCSLAIVLLGCGLLVVQGSSVSIAVALIWQLGYIFDCADGQLARYKLQFSPIGGWLDQITDRIKEFCIFSSLIYISIPTHPNSWFWGMAAFFSVYMLEYYSQQRAQVKTANDASSRPVPKWRILRDELGVFYFNIGEQYFIYLVGLALGHPEWVFYGIIATTGAKAILIPLYTVARHLRSMRHERIA